MLSSRPSPLPHEPLALRAGVLSLLFEPTTGMVRRICCGHREVLRGIYAAVRDRNWDTIPATLRPEHSSIAPDRFTILFLASHRRSDIHFEWRGQITGEPDGTVRYDFDGQAQSAFLRNRIGFCVLHPIRECAGACARQTRPDGSQHECRFPLDIEPQIVGRGSFRDLRRLAHEVTPGLWCELEFMGDVFEMEDQRNWTDASFKTYCTPLALRFPKPVAAGERIRQSVTLRLLGTVPPSSWSMQQRGTSIEVSIDIPPRPTGRLPNLGLATASPWPPQATDQPELQSEEIVALRALRPRHLRCDIFVSRPGALSRLAAALQQAQALETELELAVHLPRQGVGDLGELSQIVSRHEVGLARVLALRDGVQATSIGTMEAVRAAFSRHGAPIGGGSDANFCELNRAQALGTFSADATDFVFWSINPQVHASDDLSIMETLEAQPATVDTARRFAPARPLVVTPVILRQRVNPVATQPVVTDPGQLPPQVDVRQLSLFGAAWTLGTIAAMTYSGVRSRQ